MTAAQVRSRPDNSDAVLAAQGDAVAFERLYRSQVARIHSLARRMAERGDALFLLGRHTEELDRSARDLEIRAGRGEIDTML